MAYTINLYDGTLLTTVADGTIDTAATNIKLIGKNFTGYGELIDENFVHMLENFADVTAPTAPLVGQIWWNSAIGTLTVYDGVQFKAVSSSTVSDTEPTGAVEGDLWWDSINEQLFVYNSISWILIGPSAAAGAGQSGAIVEIITDDVASDHVVVSTYVADSRIYITSGDATFTPNVPASYPGFGDIEPGLNLVAEGTLSGVRYNGTATNSDALNSIASGQFLRSDVDDETTAILKVVNDTGLRVGAGDDIQIGVSGNNPFMFSRNNTGGDVFIIGGQESIGVGGAEVSALTIDPDNETISLGNSGSGSGNSRVTDAADPQNAQDLVTKAYSDLKTGEATGGAILRDGTNTVLGTGVAEGNGVNPAADNSIDMGSSLLRYRDIFAVTFNGLSTEASYADVAERFEADAQLEAGTVVMLGGAKEICQAMEELSDEVFGVISTQPAHLMNAQAGTSETHPPVAMTGRVPVRVRGEVRKGDRLVSAGNGIARAASKDELTAWNVIGRSLENKYTTEEGTVEAIVSMKS